MRVSLCIGTQDHIDQYLRLVEEQDSISEGELTQLDLNRYAAIDKQLRGLETIIARGAIYALSEEQDRQAEKIRHQLAAGSVTP
jgi:hypothetical protein